MHRYLASILVFASSVSAAEAFTSAFHSTARAFTSSRRSSGIFHQPSASNGKLWAAAAPESGPNGDKPVNGDSSKEPDLLEYFDPLRSPHEYPSGIDAGASAAAASEASSSSSAEPAQESNDASADFDPFLMSPNDFPSGIDGKAQKQNRQQQERAFGFDVPAAASADNVDDDNWSPLRGAMDVEKFTDDDLNSSQSQPQQKARLTSQWAAPSATSAAPAQAYQQQQRQQEEQQGDKDADLFDVFDPRLSPHAYPGGIPECSDEEQSSASYAALSSPAPDNSQREAKVGVLLIDHGSRRASSNDRLLELASVYQERSPDNYVVRAAHMEIATPSVEDGIRELIDLGADRIVCHPYFLSPGRHVVEDIPQLVGEAMTVLDRPDIPIVTTDPVGSNINVMIDAIGNLVDGTLRELDGDDDVAEGSEDEYKLGGFFGNVQRMTDEQLD